MPRQEEFTQFNCYKILGVTPSASPEEIKSAWKKASRSHHPDHGGSHEEQVKINIAYSVLSDPIQRQAHDVHWKVLSKVSFHAFVNQGNQTNKNKKPASRNQPFNEYYTAPAHFGLKKRVEEQIEKEKEKILSDLENRAKKIAVEIKVTLPEKRRGALFFMFFMSIMGGVAFIFDLNFIWILVALFGWSFLSTVFGVKVAGRKISILLFSSDKINDIAQQIARESCDRDIRSLQKYFSILTYVSELLSQKSTLSDSEEIVARRLAISFFLMGYAPSYYDRDNRIIKFSDGSNSFLVRYRHRSGAPTNISYVEKLVELMKLYRSSSGYLFCSSNLSDNAAEYAEKNNIKWYTLDTMNNWVNSVSASDRSGPEGDILKHLSDLKTLVDSIFPLVSTRRRSPYSRYRRRRY